MGSKGEWQEGEWERVQIKGEWGIPFDYDVFKNIIFQIVSTFCKTSEGYGIRATRATSAIIWRVKSHYEHFSGSWEGHGNKESDEEDCVGAHEEIVQSKKKDRPYANQ